jgi:hypothetical protein
MSDCEGLRALMGWKGQRGEEEVSSLSWTVVNSLDHSLKSEEEKTQKRMRGGA